MTIRVSPLKTGRHERGVTLIELLITTAISVLIVAGLGSIVRVSLESKAALAERTELTRDASFAMERMVRAVGGSRRLLLPFPDNPATNWPEHLREQTVPPSPPIGDSTLATAVLAVALPAYVDLDFDGRPDADDDGDGQFDEDSGGDNQFDYAPGIRLVDDDGDGLIDEGVALDNDEDGVSGEDPIDGIDNDGDGRVDEDAGDDMTGSGCPGLCGVDDDADGSVDEGASTDDDEHGGANEDNLDPLVFYLDGNRLVERMPVPWNEDGISLPDGPVDGRDFVVSVIAENVTRLRFERVPASSGRSMLLDITLELTGAGGQTVSLNRRARVGALP